VGQAQGETGERQYGPLRGDAALFTQESILGKEGRGYSPEKNEKSNQRVRKQAKERSFQTNSGEMGKHVTRRLRGGRGGGGKGSDSQSGGTRQTKGFTVRGKVEEGSGDRKQVGAGR